MPNNMETFAKFSAKLYLNVKFRKFAAKYPRAALVWVSAITYCADQRTDGRVEEYALRSFLGARPRDITALMDHGFLEEDGETYLIHDYLESQLSNEKISEISAKRSTAGRRGMESRWGGKPTDSKGEASSPDLADNKPDNKTDNKPDSKRITSVIAKPYQTDNKPITDIDIDKKEDLPKGKSKKETPPSKPDTDTITATVKPFWPVNRFDGETSNAIMQIQIDWPKIVKAADGTNPETFLIGKARDYVAATEPRFVKRFSKWMASEGYLRDWKPEQPSQPSPPLSKSQQNLMTNMANTWKYMTDEEKARSQRNGGLYGFING